MIHLDNLKKTFGDTVAVADMSLDISPGEVFGLLGPNGAGKTTTVNMVVDCCFQMMAVSISGEWGPRKIRRFAA